MRVCNSRTTASISYEELRQPTAVADVAKNRIESMHVPKLGDGSHLDSGNTFSRARGARRGPW